VEEGRRRIWARGHCQGCQGEGYHLVLSSEIVLYAENDLTDDVLNVLNKQEVNKK
jgi:Skp family chaperone for outer membrane proteins